MNSSQPANEPGQPTIAMKEATGLCTCGECKALGRFARLLGAMFKGVYTPKNNLPASTEAQ